MMRSVTLEELKGFRNALLELEKLIFVMLNPIITIAITRNGHGCDFMVFNKSQERG